jgi:phosphoribosyl 1,2-cyclic phosphodiesterase
MAGTRPDTKPQVNANNPFINGDALFVTNPQGDHNIGILELQRTMRDGSGLETVEDLDTLTFATKRDLNNISTPENSNYRIKDGKLQLFNVSTSLWHSIWIAAGQGAVPTLQWSNEGDE